MTRVRVSQTHFQQGVERLLQVRFPSRVAKCSRCSCSGTPATRMSTGTDVRAQNPLVPSCNAGHYNARLRRPEVAPRPYLFSFFFGVRVCCSEWLRGLCVCVLFGEGGWC